MYAIRSYYETGGPAHLLEVLGHRRQQCRVDAVGMPHQLDVAGHDFGGRYRRAVGHRPAGGVQDGDAEVDGVAIGLARHVITSYSIDYTKLYDGR